MDKKPFDLVTCTHCVFPTKDVVDSKTELPFTSVWIIKDDEEFTPLKQSGYQISPYIVVRWDTDETQLWGRGPAVHSLPAARQLNTATRLVMRSNEKRCDPPLWATSTSIINTKALTSDAGQILWGEPGSIPPQAINLTGDHSLTPEVLSGLAMDIGELFYNSLFVFQKQTKQQTAYEISQIVSSQFKQISPMLGRLQKELYNPLINKTLELLISKIEVPQDLTDYTVDYVSQSKKQQQLMQLEPIQQFLSMVMQLAPAAPQIVQALDTEQIVRKAAELFNVPVELLKSEDQLKLEQMNQQQMQQQQQQVDLQQQQVDTMATAAGIPQL